MAELSLETVTNVARDAFYVSVGAGVIAFQKLQVQRVELTETVCTQLDDAKVRFDEAKGRIDEAKDTAEKSLGSVSELVEDRVKLVEERLTALETRLETILSQVEDQPRSPLPEGPTPGSVLLCVPTLLLGVQDWSLRWVGP